jgi:hypothetical protein
MIIGKTFTSLKKIFFSLLLYGALLLWFTGCAKVGSPSGGPKDETPPKVVESIPKNKAVNIKTDRIEITFDEFIALKNINDELVISPPLKSRPFARIRNKTLVIDIDNELKENITYTFNFGNAITDNNEGNLLPDFEFIFSTGNTIDSLSVTGKAINAYNHKAEKEKIYIMLYDNLNDSAPYYDLPLYITKASAEGRYAINNIKADTFRLFALKDANNNFKFDLNNEMIAFSDSFIIVGPDKIEKISYVKDSSLYKPKTPPAEKKKSKSTEIEDTFKIPAKELYALNVDLFLFIEENMQQKLIIKERPFPEMIKLGFSRPLFDSLIITPLNFRSSGWYLQDMSQSKDSVKLWITDSLITKMDTLILALTYTTTDSAKNFISRNDTIFLRYREKTSRASSARNKDKESVQSTEYLTLTSSINKQSIVDLNHILNITSSSPICNFDLEKFKLTKYEDTIEYKQKLTLLKNDLSMFSIKFSTDWEENMPYKLFIEPGAIKDIYGKINDTIEISFRTQKSDYYGRILLTLDNNNYPVIIQLMDEKENIVSEKYTSENGLLVFDFLTPKKYKLKAIFDANANKKWDTGNYLKQLQPERVIYYPDIIELRSNWDIETNWLLND